MQYEDFVIQLEPGEGAEFNARVLQSPAGEGESRFTLPFEIGQLDAVLAGMEQRLGRKTRDATGTSSRALVSPALAQKTDPKEIGDQLFQSLFSGQVKTLYDQSLGGLHGSADRGLRIKLKLRSTDPRVAPLEKVPWEMLRRRETDDYLSLSRLTSVVRYLDVPRRTQPIPLPPKLRVLVLIASPYGLPPLDLDRERENLEAVLGREKKVEVVFLEQASVSALRKALVEETFHVIHFMGHGGFDAKTGEGLLYFENERGGAEAVTGKDLATKLKDFKSLGLVFLNACETARSTADSGATPFAGVASALVLGGLPAVVAMQFPISDQAAIAFSHAFYRRLAKGDSVDETLTEGRQAIHSALPEAMEWATPVLFLRIPDGNVFRAEPRKKKNDLGVSHWLKLMVLVPALVLLTLGVSNIFGNSREFELDEEFTIVDGVDGVKGVVTKVEITKDGKMRVHFGLKNESEESREVGIQYAQTYLADEEGHEYKIVSAGRRGVEIEGLSESMVLDNLDPGDRSDGHWFEIEPRSKRTSYKVSLVDHKSQEFSLITLDLPEKFRRHLPPESRPDGVPEGTIERSKQDILLDSPVEGLVGHVAAIDYMENGRMRWNLDMLNKSGARQNVGVDFANSYLEDEAGYRYEVRAYSGYGSVPRALRRKGYVEFDMPRAGSRNFRIVLKTRDGDFTSRSPLERIEFEGYTPAPEEEELEPPPAPALGILTGPVAFRNTDPSLESTLTGVAELGGRMRWQLEFVNRATGKAVDIGINYPETYLADELGNFYEVTGSDTKANVGREALQERIAPGKKTHHWLEFARPMAGTRRFQLFLFSHDKASLKYDSFKVPLRFSKGFSRTAPKESVSGDSHTISLNQSLGNNVEGLEIRLSRVALFKPDRMRWYFELLNGTRQDRKLGFNYSQIELQDEYGGRYEIQGSKAQKTTGTHEERVRREIRMHHWIDFSAPRNGARTFRAHLAPHRADQFDFDREIEITFPEYPLEYSKLTVQVKPIESLELRAGEVRVESSVAGVSAKLTGIERLENGRIRWTFDFVNASASTVILGFDHRQVYMSSDMDGSTYKLLEADTNPNPRIHTQVYTEPLPANTQVSHWFDFSAPSSGTRKFMCVLETHNTRAIRFAPVTAELPES